MSDIMMDRCREYGPGSKKIKFTFFPNGTSTTAMTVAAGTLVTDGGVVSVTRTATAGKFTCLLSNNYLKLLSKQVSVQLAGDTTDLTAQFGTIDLAASGGATVIVRLLAGATNTDMSSNANNSVSVTLEIQDNART
jgi:hypothetical protein